MAVPKKEQKNDKEEEAYPMPPPIPDTPENVARIAMQGPPKKEWRYLKNKKKGSKS